MERPEELLIEVSGVARRLGCSPTTVRNLERRGDLPLGARLESTGYRVWKLSEIEAVQALRADRQLVASGEAA